MIVVTELTPGLAEAYGEMSELMQAVASGQSPQRGAAQRYTLCRQALLQQAGGGPQASLQRADLGTVPGFLVQCASLYKFIEFITLYDPDPATRARFVARAFGAADAPAQVERPPVARRRDIFADEIPVERAWPAPRTAVGRG